MAGVSLREKSEKVDGLPNLHCQQQRQMLWPQVRWAEQGRVPGNDQTMQSGFGVFVINDYIFLSHNHARMLLLFPASQCAPWTTFYRLHPTPLDTRTSCTVFCWLPLQGTTFQGAGLHCASPGCLRQRHLQCFLWVGQREVDPSRPSKL